MLIVLIHVSINLVLRVEIRDYDTQRRTTGSRSGSGGLLLSPIGRDTLDTERRSILDPIDRLHDGSIAIDMASIGKPDSLDGMGSGSSFICLWLSAALIC